MTVKIESAYWVKIYASGPIEVAKQLVRKECLRVGLCVTIEPTLFVYTGGEESGFCIGLIQYPRFPLPEHEIWERALDLATKIRDATYQLSFLIMDRDRVYWQTAKDD